MSDHKFKDCMKIILDAFRHDEEPDLEDYGQSSRAHAYRELHQKGFIEKFTGWRLTDKGRQESEDDQLPLFPEWRLRCRGRRKAED